MSGSDDTDAGIVSRAAPSLTRYDLLLAAIPAAFCLAFVASQFLPVPTRSALTAASLVGAALVADGLFRRPPRLPRRA